MPRKPSFDHDAAVEAAMRLFWRKGYTETSLVELLGVMKIREGSFYNAFGGKKKLFALCLERYQSTVMNRQLTALAQAKTARQGVEAYFEIAFERFEDPGIPSRMCMVAALSNEDTASDSELRQQAVTGTAELRTALLERLEVDQTRGALPEDLDINALAGLLTTYIQGIWRVALVNYDREDLSAQIQNLLNAFLPHPA